MTRSRADAHERVLLVLALLGPLPAVLVTAALGGWQGPQTESAWAGAVLGALVWLWAAVSIRARVTRALASVSNLIAALRQGDFTVRGHPGGGDSLGAVLTELNGLAGSLVRQRSEALEASALLGKVMAEIEVAVFAFDRARRLKLVNRSGERLLSSAGLVAIGTPAAALGLSGLLEGPTPRTVELAFTGAVGRWELRRSSFRLEGLPHELLVLSDLRRALREEERQAWQRVVRVIGHEINNSLAPIGSIAAGLSSALSAPAATRPADLEEDLARGLEVIGRRSAALDRFMTSYAQLAKLPAPRIGSLDVRAWMRRVVELERRLPVRLAEGPELSIPGDGDQLDQLMINLLRNGVDAALETGGGIELSWRRLARHVEIQVADEGLGLADTSNLFVPFFTTKPNGTGIGLVLSRQICEAHQGTLTLEQRLDRPGALARLSLPL